MRVRFTSPAAADLDEILDYIALKSPFGARRVGRQIERTLDLLLENPLIGRRTDDPRIRRLAVGPYPYLIFYEPHRDELIVHAVMHGARDPKEMPGA